MGFDLWIYRDANLFINRLSDLRSEMHRTAMKILQFGARNWKSVRFKYDESKVNRMMHIIKI